MDRLLQGVEREQPQGRPHRLISPAALAVMGEQPGERLERQLAQPLALGEEPLLERWRGPAESLEQVAPIERHGALERLRRALGHRPLERGHIDVGRGRIQDDGVIPGDQARGRHLGQGSPEGTEGLPETRPRRRLRGVGPEQGGELAAGMGLEGEIGQEGLGLPGGEDDRSAGFELCLKSPQKREFQAYRGLQCSSRFRQEALLSIP